MSTVNLFSGNQADIESDISGFFVGGSSSSGQGPFAGGGVTISRDTTLSAHGAACLKAQTDGFGTYQALEVRVNVSGQFVASGTYTLSGYIYSVAGGGSLRIYCQSSSGDLSPVSTETLAAGWNRYSIEVTLPNPITQSWIGLRFDTGGTAQALTFWVDCMQFQSGSLTPWVPGGGQTPPYMAYIQGLPVDIIAGTLSVQNAIGQRSTGSISVWTMLGITWGYGTTIAIYDSNSTLVYAGYTTKDKVSKGPGSRQGTGYLEHTIQLMDNCYRADKRRVFKSYLGVTAGYIVNDLLGAYLAAEGVTATATSIATGPTITEVIWSGTKSVSEALTWLAVQAGYWWQIDLNGVLWFQPYGGVVAPFVIDGTQVDAMQTLTVEFGNDMYVNRQYAKGAFAEKGSKTSQLHETFHGNGNTRSFTLSYPVHTIYQVLLNSVDITAMSLTKGSSGGDFYYALGDAVLAQDTSQTILTSSDTLDIYYTGRYPVLASAQNQTLIAAQKAREGGTGTGLVESTYVNAKVRTLTAAFQVASSLLTHYGTDTTVLEFSIQQKGLQPGQMLTVTLPDYGLTNKQMLINNVNIDDQGPDGFSIWFRVQAVGSPVESAQWQTYWQNLMNQSSDPTDLTDTQDTSLALLSTTTVTRTPIVTVTQMKTSCPICGPSTIIPVTIC